MAELLPTEFSIISDLEDHGEKYGLGSSGAVVAGMLDAVARQCNQALTDADLFRMSVLAQQISRHTGSGVILLQPFMVGRSIIVALHMIGLRKARDL